MARAALNWTTIDLARAAGVGANTVNRFETGEDARISSVEKIQAAFEGAGVEFIRNGVKVRPAKAREQIAEVAPEDEAAHPEPAVGKNAPLVQVDGVSRVRDPLKRR